MLLKKIPDLCSERMWGTAKAARRVVMRREEDWWDELVWSKDKVSVSYVLLPSVKERLWEEEGATFTTSVG
jgi:hypothetical protein